MSVRSTLEAKARTTIPRAVRTALQLEEGDEIVYVIDGGRVRLAKAASEIAEDPFATFDEWNGDADRKAYGAL